MPHRIIQAKRTMIIRARCAAPASSHAHEDAQCTPTRTSSGRVHASKRSGARTSISPSLVQLCMRDIHEINQRRNPTCVGVLQLPVTYREKLSKRDVPCDRVIVRLESDPKRSAGGGQASTSAVHAGSKTRGDDDGCTRAASRLGQPRRRFWWKIHKSTIGGAI